MTYRLEEQIQAVRTYNNLCLEIVKILENDPEQVTWFDRPVNYFSPSDITADDITHINPQGQGMVVYGRLHHHLTPDYDENFVFVLPYRLLSSDAS